MPPTNIELQQALAGANQTIASNLTNHNVTTEKVELQTIELSQNYSILINKLEQLALGLDSAFENLSLNRKELDVSVSEFPLGAPAISSSLSPSTTAFEDLFGNSFSANRIPSPRKHHVDDEVEYTRVVSDIWIGVILTLLIVSVIFFICSCFLYHKFQKWKTSYRTNNVEPVEICRRFPTDYEVESLPSYTIVSGLPTYDDALEEFRKAGIILAPSVPMVKLFEREKEVNQNLNDENEPNDNPDADNISISSTCTCGANSDANISNGRLVIGPASNNIMTPFTPHNSMVNLTSNQNLSNPLATQSIEISPEQLQQLSQKRLSLQIQYHNSIRQRSNSRPRVDLYRQANRNNLLRSRAMNANNPGRSISGGNNNTPNSINVGPEMGFPQIHRSSSSSSLSLSNDQSLLDRRVKYMHHRGSLC